MIYVGLILLLLISIPCNAFVSRHFDDRWWAPMVLLATAPGCTAALFVLAAFSIPYFFLYPERHAAIWDFHGSPEQKEALKQYRRGCAERGIIRRLLEHSGLSQYTGPDWPDILVHDPHDDPATSG